MERRIYFDNSATTPMDTRVVAAMQPYLYEQYGNPSSLHWLGRETREAVEHARRQVAELVNGSPDEIVFTASGTEADNMALIGLAEANSGVKNHLITSAIEHPAILETCKYLEKHGVEVTYLGVDEDGMLDPQDLKKAIRPTTYLVSIMTANNVVGTIQPIAALVEVAHQAGVPFHTDAVQAAGKLVLDAAENGYDLISLSAHKFHGPKGIGALYIRNGIELRPIIHGGGQERGLRSATENVPGIVGMGLAAELARLELAEEAARLVDLREQIIAGVLRAIPNAYLVGHRYKRLPGHVCLGFAGQEGEAVRLLLALDEAGIAVSTGSACSAHHGSQPSYILQAMGFDPVRARGSLRVTLGRMNTAEEVGTFLEVLPQAVQELRSFAMAGSRA